VRVPERFQLALSTDLTGLETDLARSIDDSNAPAADMDADGVSDETEGWLGTSNFTDESGVDGRTDAGATASVERVERQREPWRAFSNEEAPSAQLSSAMDPLDERPRELSKTPLGVRLAQLRP
jgi:hypothetical protein